MTLTFRQSVNDFPLNVTLGSKVPAWGLSRWRGNSALRFVPPDDEGFTLRGDRQRLVYKGRRRSHRFTILGDGAFEYDCILEREPESNVISLLMEGAERFDFFRQPDFVKDPFLKGSYAVYKKETLVGEGTGKLCHIHRPEIIDARARRCWGELSIVGNELRITIPEWWLSEASYPVVVDPTIGTTTVGSLRSQSRYPQLNAFAELVYEFGANRFLVPETVTGECTAHVYVWDQEPNHKEITPVLFDEVNGKPRYRRSSDEEVIEAILFNPHNVLEEYPPCWKTSQFSIIDSLQAGSYVWFGGYGAPFPTAFDYGGTFYKNWSEQICIDEPYEYYDEDDEEWYEYEGEWEDGPDFPHDGYEKVYDCLPSWYFDYESQQKNYVRTLTQGVTLSDSHKLKAEYKRSLTQTAEANSFLGKCLSLFQKIQEAVQGLDNNSTSSLFNRSLQENVSISELYRHCGVFFRGLFEDVEIESETKGGFAFFTHIADTVHAAGTVFRGLVLVVRIITGVFVRDYLLSRFLKAKSELILKSAVCREIILESRIC